MKPTAEAMERLRRIVGPRHWSTDEKEMAPYLEDWRGLAHGAAAILLRPGSTDEVRRIVKTCAEFGLKIVPQGGNTGLVGGATPDRSGDQILLSLTRMKAVREIDPLNNAMTVEAGVTLHEAQTIASEAERLFPLSIGSEGSATIGGAVSTNAGGVTVLRYGNMRNLVLGLEVVLPSGELWNGLSGLRKDNRGYDLKQLFIGGEGTLGIVTAATVKLFAKPRARATALAALDSPQAAVELLAQTYDACGEALTSFELLPKLAFDLILDAVPSLNQPIHGDHPWYALIELTAPSADEPLGPRLENLLGAGIERGLVRDAVIAANLAQVENLWRIRHSISEAEKKAGVSIKADISVATSKIPAFIDRATQAVEAASPGARVLAFGHLGDGNIHFNISQPEGGDGPAFSAQWPSLNKIVFDLVRDFDGSISAEHGIGTMKRDILPDYAPGVAIDLMRRIKTAIDPDNLLNPGKVLPDA